MTDATADSSQRLIKKYPNRRLYDTKTSAYITLADVKKLVVENESFKAVDAKSGEDLTRSILLQIILEEESGGVPMFSSAMLSQIIRFYGGSMQGIMGSYLEKNIQAFKEIQDRMTEQSANTYGNQFGPEAWTQFMNLQSPMLQNVMNNYVDQKLVCTNARQNARPNTQHFYGFSVQAKRIICALVRKRWSHIRRFPISEKLFYFSFSLAF